ncbi:Tim44/TimA family putative adaptor protein [Lutimaribacter sp. EGI FJ00015]|uniref:Tim44/TimA family putative adaptor protein n=1 Tax=Lutimaribacter degradans TaxID=2945989 RepID=A0ACC5ZUG1_9RHOB|nr:Tim44/TimA family putative adaptor protein [Lutimaribacter sp. EGI FJ00013]MCM2561983.1 Tim44/TimA family putative adaptor protein [Lutimaribacter sp. EGI FJ00013]MCO0612985.1 Tim44/TimA family putative adaptor protein [Lutimaribacter sp. EGI FJ00015]MCO0635815.1 Tim44/TimA family putative adaptor protein [Lutimaribacter sp. EGI FJ00014]
MNNPILQLLVLAGIAVFLILRLKSVLGTRAGYERPRVENSRSPDSEKRRSDFAVIEGGPDHDITDHAEEGSETAQALAKMKRIEPSFSVAEFLQGARGAYEMILMGFERGQMDEIKPFLSDDIYEAFSEVVEAREQQGLTIEADFIGLRELALDSATFDDTTQEAEVSVRFVGELTSVVRDSNGEIVEGKPNEIKRQRDTWTFARQMGSDNPNWQLVATGE